MQREYPIKIYTTYKNQFPKMTFVQGDTQNNKIYLEFYDDINVPMTDIKEATATVKRQDSNTYSYGMDYFVIEGNLVTFILPPSTTFISGTCSASISVYDSDMGRLTTQTFDFDVTPELVGNTAIDDSNDYPILTKLIADTQDVKDQTESKYAQALALSSQSANLEIVGARKGEVDLPTKIGKIDTQISNITTQQTTNTNTVNTHTSQIASNTTAINNIGNASPKGTYATLTDLQTTYPSGTTGIYVVTADGGWYYWNGAWTKGGIYQSTGIADNSITPVKTTFFSLGKNLFNKATATIGYYVNQNNGTLAASSSYDVSDFIAVSANTTYSFVNDTSIRIAYYDINKVFISGVAYPSSPITTPTNTAYVRISFLVATLDKQQFELGSSSTTYENYKIFIPKTYRDTAPIDLSQVPVISTKQTDFIIVGKNLFDKTTAKLNTFCSDTNGYEYSSSTYHVSDFIPVLPNTAYSRTGTLRYCFYDANKVFISGSQATVYTFTTPANCYYIRVTIYQNELDVYQIELGSNRTPYNPFGYVLNRSVNDYMKFTPNMVLPPTIPALVGKEINIYFENLMDDTATKYQFNVTCSIGLQQNVRWTCVPTVAGTTPITIDIYKEHTLIGTVTSNIVVKDIGVGNAVNKKVNPIGDSTTAQAIYTQELLNLFNADVMDLTLIGSKGTAPNKHEGINGWTITKFYTDATSPFVFNGVFDYGQYISTNALSVPDYVTFHLGINDVFGYTDDKTIDTDITTYLNNLQAMIDNIKTYNASIKIGVMVTIPPSKNQDAFGTAYQNGQTQWRYKYNNIKWIKALIAKFVGKEAQGIYLIPINVNLDTENNMFTQTVAINSRNSNTIARQSNGVHPADIGYYQMADVIYYWLKGFES